MARARRRTSQCALPVRSVNAEGMQQHAGPAARELAVELREAQVVADREPDRAENGRRRHDLVPGHDGPRFLEVLHARQVDVEEVDLAVDGERRPVGPEEDAGVADARVAGDALGKRAREQRDARPAGEGRHPAHPGAVEVLGLGHGLALGAEEGEVLGEADEGGSARRRLLHEALGGGEVALHVGGGGHLHDGREGPRAHFAGPRRPVPSRRARGGRTGEAGGVARAAGSGRGARDAGPRRRASPPAPLAGRAAARPRPRPAGSARRTRRTAGTRRRPAGGRRRPCGRGR